MARARSQRDPGERSGQDFWAKFEEQASKIGWTLVKEDKGEGLEMVGWLQDGFGNEIHVIKRADVPDLRLVSYLFFRKEALTREILLRIADICWTDGLSWRIDQDSPRGEATLLLGCFLPLARIHRDHLWYVFNVMVFCEFAVRKLMPARQDPELLSMLHRFTRNWARLNRRPAAGRSAADEGPPPPAPAPEEETFPGAGGLFRVEEQSERFAVYSLTDPKGDQCTAVCSRAPEHREFCWLVPEETDVCRDFVRFAAVLTGRKAAKQIDIPVEGGAVENQVVRILGDWAREWKFSEVHYDRHIFLGVDDRKPTFHLYRMESLTHASWILHNSSVCDSLWVMDEDMFREFKDLLGRWIKRIEVV